MQTIIEMPEFISLSRKLLSAQEVIGLIDFVAVNPLAGDVIAGTGGVRKLRWARNGMGKRGGARVIYLFGGDDIPVTLITLYAKNAKNNLTHAERNAMAEASRIITKELRGE